jgi:CRP-like cAMP-binding protein
MYFLTKGEVHFVDGKDKHVYRILKQGAYFGDVEMLKGIERKYTVVAGTDCHFLTLARKVTFIQFLGLIQRDFPVIWAEIHEVAEKRDKLNSQALAQFQVDRQLYSDGRLPPSIERPRRNSSIFLPTPTDSLLSLDESVTSLEQTLDSLEADMQATNSTIEEALDLLRSQRELKIRARLDPLPNKGVESRSEAVTSDGKGWDGS